MAGIHYTTDGFTTPLVKPKADTWFAELGPSRIPDDHPMDVSNVGMIFRLFEIYFLLLQHVLRVAPWAPWRFSLARGRLELRKRGRRHRQSLTALRDVVLDDGGLALHFDDGPPWTIPSQPAEVVELPELAEHLRRASRSARAAAAHQAAGVDRARAALRGVRAAPERER